MEVSIIACVAWNNVIGYNGKLPWDIPEDLQRFRDLTMGKPVIMGANTFRSIALPLDGRTNIVVTSRYGNTSTSHTEMGRNGQLTAVVTVPSVETALSQLAAGGTCDEVFVIGGQSIYEQSIKYATRMYITEVYTEFEGDAFFPEFDYTEWERMPCVWSKCDVETGMEYAFVEYRSKRFGMSH